MLAFAVEMRRAKQFSGGGGDNKTWSAFPQQQILKVSAHTASSIGQ